MEDVRWVSQLRKVCVEELSEAKVFLLTLFRDREGKASTLLQPKEGLWFFFRETEVACVCLCGQD